MYFPYLRGKQYEVIAIRELVEKKLIDKTNILPIIEPVNLSRSLNITINILKNLKYPIGIIINPKVGSLIDQQSNIINNFLSNFNDFSIFPCLYTNNNLNEEIQYLFKNNTLITKNQLIIIHDINISPDIFQSAFLQDENPYKNLIPYQKSMLRRGINNKILFEDRFPEQPRNADYLNNPDEFFSDDHLFNTEDGFEGFSDYSIIGSSYSESGFKRPYAVAIHITYFDENSILKIRHFVSDSNLDYQDIPNKFYEALQKLIIWKNNSAINTYALAEFENIYNNQTFPNLGPVKKLSIMHHLELMNNFFESQK